MPSSSNYNKPLVFSSRMVELRAGGSLILVPAYSYSPEEALKEFRKNSFRKGFAMRVEDSPDHPQVHYCHSLNELKKGAWCMKDSERQDYLGRTISYNDKGKGKHDLRTMDMMWIDSKQTVHILKDTAENIKHVRILRSRLV